jgi:hypothetical protein
MKLTPFLTIYLSFWCRDFKDNDIKHNDAHHNGTKDKWLICDSQHDSIECCYVACHYAECQFFCYAECHYTASHYAECRGAMPKNAPGMLLILITFGTTRMALETRLLYIFNGCGCNGKWHTHELIALPAWRG